MKIPSVRSVRLPQGRVGRIGLAAGAVVVVAALVVGGIRWFTALPADAAFRSVGTTVTEAQLAQRLEALEALYGIRAPSDPDGADRFRRESAKAVAVDMAVQQAAAERGIVTAELQARGELDKIIADKGPDGRKQFVALLGQVGASEQDVVDELVRQDTTRRLYDDVTKGLPEVTEDDLHKAFDERRDLMAVPEQRHVRNLVVRTKEDADAALKRAVGGEDFGAVARQVTLDGSTRDSGGDLGLVAADQLENGFAAAAFGAAPQAFFGPVQTRFGWNVGQVTEIVPAKPLSFEQVHEDLRTTLASERALSTWQQFLTDRIADADIEYADAYRPADPDSPPVASGASAGPAPR
ncbi:peptidyl-prolyl cis-trans isomerase [Pseudonocardia sp. RS010]|uniref:peptidyl-prolyl cis-trans isomerase n=1 Tax=Pseudonocardia sp. RS010 TaxID=3385979 RepID=UPI0039A30C92